MKLDAKIRSVFVFDDKKVIFFKGRRQPKIVAHGYKEELPDWHFWKVAFMTFYVKQNKIKRVREFKLKKKVYLQVVTVEEYPSRKEKPFVFKLVKYY
jgi:hypothetical protein